MGIPEPITIDGKLHGGMDRNGDSSSTQDV